MKLSHLNLDKIKTDIRVIFALKGYLREFKVKDERGKGNAYRYTLLYILLFTK